MKEKIFDGYLNITRNNKAILWTIPFDNRYRSFNFPQHLVKKYKLVSGVRLKCKISNNKIRKIINICGKDFQDFVSRSHFKTLVPINPQEKYDFGASNSLSLRFLDLLSPIGKGTRGLIVSPPRAGKTMLLESIANELEQLDPDLNVIVLLIDERPEEVTSFIRNTNADVLHSSLDQSATSHVALSSFLLNHIRIELECGNDIVVLIDSLTRMGRAFNISGGNNNRTMSGGLSSGALELPRKIFGMARNIDEGGSCTILSTILRDTGSRMDEVIFQEFKGTGNSEIILDRQLAEQRLFPAINITETATRKEEIFRIPEETEKINQLRRELLQTDKITAHQKFSALINNSNSNKEMLEVIKSN